VYPVAGQVAQWRVVAGEGRAEVATRMYPLLSSLEAEAPRSPGEGESTSAGRQGHGVSITAPVPQCVRGHSATVSAGQCHCHRDYSSIGTDLLSAGTAAQGCTILGHSDSRRTVIVAQCSPPSPSDSIR